MSSQRDLAPIGVVDDADQTRSRNTLKWWVIVDLATGNSKVEHCRG
jgi:hypothetical protein